MAPKPKIKIDMEKVTPEDKQLTDNSCTAISVSEHHTDGSIEDEHDEEKRAADSCEDVDVEQQFEECIRDLCTVRKTMPQKCAKLLEDYFEVIMPNYESCKSKISEAHGKFKYDSEMFRKGSAEYKETDRSYKDIQSLDFKGLEERCKELIKLHEVKKEMGLNNTQELLFSHKRTSDESPDTKVNKHKRVFQPDEDMIPSFTTPASLSKQDNARSSTSKIPRPKKDKMVPETPLSRPTSLRKNLLKKSHGKT